MTGSLNFSNLSAAAAVRPTTAVQRTAPAAPPPPPTETQKPETTTRPETGKPGGGVHMAAEEMEAHVAEALEQSPAFEEDQAPLIDPSHLDEMPEEVPEAEGELEGPAETAEAEESEEADEIEGEGEVEEAESKEIEAAETEEAEEESESGEKGEGEGEGESDSEAAEHSPDHEKLKHYLESELARYQREKDQPTQRFVYLAGQAERSRKAQVAAALEAKIGGLAPVLPGMPGDFIALAGALKGRVIDHIGVAKNQPFQAPAFKQALLSHLTASGIDRVLLDLEHVPPLQRPALLALLKTPKSHATWVYLSSGQIQGLG